MSTVIRTWNVFHGMSSPPDRHSYLRQVVQLATEDEPDVVCLQEVPAWALDRLGAWSGMQVFGAVAKRPLLPRELGRTLTALNQGLLRSLLVGQANAILLRQGLRAVATDMLVLNPPSFRRRVSRELGLPANTRRRWAKERRVCHAVRLALPDGRTMTVANLHATSYRIDERLADAEVLRAAVFLDAVAAPNDIAVLAGDFNLVTDRSPALAEIAAWGFSLPGRGIDHILVRGATTSPERRWPEERRVIDGALVSDHAPVELELE